MPPAPSTILGVFDGTHDAGAALVVDGRLVAAANEERFTRVKGQGGWPEASIRACLAVGGRTADAVQAVAFAGLVNPNPGLRLARGLQRRWRLDEQWFYRPQADAGGRLADWLQFDSPFPRQRSDQPLARALAPLLAGRLRAQLASTLGAQAGRVAVHLRDHHRCHAASAWHSAGWDEGLVVVADGLGDGLATTVWRGQGARLERIDARPYPDSYGLLYATLTGFLGFRPFRHEGKLTGLAAHGDPDAVKVPFPFEGPPLARRFTQRFGQPLRPWLEQLRPYRREDVCAWVQHHLEQELGGLVAGHLRATGLSRVALAGGVFANVRVNQHLALLPEVEQAWVFPHMGDGGLAIGAAWDLSEPAADPAVRSLGFPHAFLGPGWTDAELVAIVDAAQAAGLPGGGALRVQRPADLALEVASRMARGQVVARFAGAMEVGPRALGHRSILAPADPQVPARLNAALARSDFMPFAPLLRAEDAPALVEGLSRVPHSARFMTVSLQARPALAEACPAVVHKDGSLRPQVVHKDELPGLHAILTAYLALTGRPALINTSFNMHEEPIVASPQDALRAFLAAGLDALAIGPLLVTSDAAGSR